MQGAGHLTLPRDPPDSGGARDESRGLESLLEAVPGHRMQLRADSDGAHDESRGLNILLEAAVLQRRESEI